MNSVDVPPDDGQLELPTDDPISSADLRTLITDAVGDVDADRLEVVVRIVSALVDNAYQHAEAPRRLRVRGATATSPVRVEVEDGSPSRLPILGRPDRSRGGLSLLMVNRLSTHWGYRVHDRHKTVWAEITLA